MALNLLLNRRELLEKIFAGIAIPALFTPPPPFLSSLIPTASNITNLDNDSLVFFKVKVKSQLISNSNNIKTRKDYFSTHKNQISIDYHTSFIKQKKLLYADFKIQDDKKHLVVVKIFSNKNSYKEFFHNIFDIKKNPKMNDFQIVSITKRLLSKTEKKFLIANNILLQDINSVLNHYYKGSGIES